MPGLAVMAIGNKYAYNIKPLESAPFTPRIPNRFTALILVIHLVAVFVGYS